MNLFRIELEAELQEKESIMNIFNTFRYQVLFLGKSTQEEEKNITTP